MIDQALRRTELTSEIQIVILLTLVAMIIIMQIYIVHIHDTLRRNTMSITIVTYTRSVNVYEIIMCELSKYCLLQHLTLK